jgi:hypothetical protein
MPNPDYVLAMVRQRANAKLADADKQPAKHADFAESCRAEAAFYWRIADAMEELMRDAADARREAIRA